MSSQQQTQTVQERVNAVPNWFHSIDLGNGVITPGSGKSQEQLQQELKSIRLPDLKGKSILDIGAWDGFFSFAAERAGAKRVVSLDHYVWSIDWPAVRRYIEERQQQNAAPEPWHTIPSVWQPQTLPGKIGYDTAHQILQSKAVSVVADFMTVDLERLGTFDVVLYLGVLYHIENPLEALKRLAAVTGELAVIETDAVAVPGYEEHALCEFFPSDERAADPTNWWAPNQQALEGMCRAAGFRRVEILVGRPQEAMTQQQPGNAPAGESGGLSPLRAALLRRRRTPDTSNEAAAKPQIVRYRAIVHAYK